MSINLGGFEFEGPYFNVETLDDRSGVYAILTESVQGSGRYKVVDVGESGSVRSRVANHDRAACWERNRLCGLYYAVYYTADRKRVEQKVRERHDPPCGSY